MPRNTAVVFDGCVMPAHRKHRIELAERMFEECPENGPVFFDEPVRFLDFEKVHERVGDKIRVTMLLPATKVEGVMRRS